LAACLTVMLAVQVNLPLLAARVMLSAVMFMEGGGLQAQQQQQAGTHTHTGCM
jgi:hypothetical protein